jgi:hypothetical protein
MNADEHIFQFGHFQNANGIFAQLKSDALSGPCAGQDLGQTAHLRHSFLGSRKVDKDTNTVLQRSGALASSRELAFLHCFLPPKFPGLRGLRP